MEYVCVFLGWKNSLQTQLVGNTVDCDMENDGLVSLTKKFPFFNISLNFHHYLLVLSALFIIHFREQHEIFDDSIKSIESSSIIF